VRHRNLFWSAWGWVVCVSALLMLPGGCGESGRRAAGKNLREATRAARSLYDQAQALLSNPQILPQKPGIEPNPLPPKALNLLDQAEKELAAALAENYENIKGDPEAVPSESAAIAKNMLGLIRRLRGQYYRWTLVQTQAEASAVLRAADDDLDRLQWQNTILQTISQAPAEALEKLQKDESAAKELKAQAEKDRQDVMKQIEAKKADIAKLQGEIQADMQKAGALRTEAGQAPTEAAGLVKLEEALTLEKQADRNRSRIQEEEAELARLNGVVASTDIRAGQAESKLQAIAGIRQTLAKRSSDEQEAAKDLGKQLDESCRKVSQAVQTLGGLCRQAVDQENSARKALEAADKAFAEAAGLLADQAKAQVLSEQAQAKVSAGEMCLAMGNFRGVLNAFTTHINEIWGTLGQGASAKPESLEIGNLIRDTAQSTEQAIKEYDLAVKLLEEASRSTVTNRWFYDRDLIVTYVNYAKAHEAAGNIQEANEYRKRAKDKLPSVESEAQRAGKPRDAKDLRIFIEANTPGL
jgi:tetratricopeptide (TPR) repeat protein